LKEETFLPSYPGLLFNIYKIGRMNGGAMEEQEEDTRDEKGRRGE
jgi:hypothetical protein